MGDCDIKKAKINLDASQVGVCVAAVNLGSYFKQHILNFQE